MTTKTYTGADSTRNPRQGPGDSQAALNARQQIKRLLSDPVFRRAYYSDDVTSPAHRNAVAKLEQLFEASNPSPGQDRTPGASR